MVLLLVGINFDAERVEPRTDQSRPLAGDRVNVAKRKRQRRERDFDLLLLELLPQVRDRAAVTRIGLRLRSKQLAIGAFERSARQRVNRRRIVQPRLMSDTAHEGDSVHLLTHLGEMLADVQAGHGRADRLELAPHFGRRMRLEV